MIAYRWFGRAVSLSMDHQSARSSSFACRYHRTLHSLSSRTFERPPALSSKEPSLISSLNDVESQSFEDTTPRSLTSLPPSINPEYTNATRWTCRKCGNINRHRVYCPCGEVNTVYQMHVKQLQSAYRKSAVGKAVLKQDRARQVELCRATMDTIREQILSQSCHANGQTCDWEGGCTVPKHLLNMFRIRSQPGSRTALSQLHPAQKLAAVERETVDGKVLIRTVCSVHQATLLKERQAGDLGATQKNRTTLFKIKQLRKLELKHCDHARCFHPDIIECNVDTMHQFGLVHVVDVAMTNELNLTGRAKSISIYKGAPKENLRKATLVPELEKCRLMHRTCAQDHHIQLRSINITEKKHQLRQYLSTSHRIPEWYRDAIKEALDRHDASDSVID